MVAGLFPYQGKVSLVKVEPGSVAEKAGLQVNDAIVALDGERVRTMQEIVRVIRDKAGVAVNLTIERAGVRQDVQVTPDMKVDERATRSDV